MKRLLLMTLFTTAALASCSDNDNDTKADSAPQEDASADSANLEDVSVSDREETDVTDQDAHDSTPPIEAGTGEFIIRKPKEVLCKSSDPLGEGKKMLQTDHVCTYAHGGQTGYVYVQTTPLECPDIVTSASRVSKVSIDLAQIKIGNTIENLSNVRYEYNGDHFADALTFDYKGVRFVYSHSSLLLDGSSCQTMHCAVIKDTSGKTVTNGCIPTRSLPVVCKQVDETGRYDTTMEDTFHSCPQ